MTLAFPQNDWADELSQLLTQPQTKTLFDTIDKLYKTNHVLPEESAVFKALSLTPYADTKVVIIGQDPYPNPDNAMGLSFSVKPNAKIPASLRNIYKERESDLGIAPAENGDLRSWAKQGVLLLNATLTVEAWNSNSHAKIGWQPFTTGIIQALNKKETPVVFILWGKFAQSYEPMIAPQHKIIKSAHPSPFSANHGFFGSKPFSKTNQYLIAENESPIDWQN